MRKHYVGTYAHKKIARFRVGICSSYKTERAIDLKLSPTNQERCVERENSKNNFQTKCLSYLKKASHSSLVFCLVSQYTFDY